MVGIHRQGTPRTHTRTLETGLDTFGRGGERDGGYMVHESGHTNFPAFKELSNSAASITEYIRSTPGKKDPGPCFLSQKPWSCPILGTWSNSLSWRAGFKGPDPTASNSSSRGGQSLLPLEALLLRTAPLPPPPSTSGLQHVGPSKLPSSPSSPLTRVSHWLWRPLPSQVDRYLISLSLSLSLSRLPSLSLLLLL